MEPRDYIKIMDNLAKDHNWTALEVPETKTDFTYLRLFGRIKPDEELYGDIIGLLETKGGAIIKFNYNIYNPVNNLANHISTFERVEIEECVGTQLFRMNYADQGCAFVSDIPDKMLDNGYQRDIRLWYKEMKKYSRTQLFKDVKKNYGLHKKYKKQLEKSRQAMHDDR